MLKNVVFACLFALMGASSLAAPQASNGRDVVILREQACSNPEVVKQLPAEIQKYFFNAEVLLKGVSYKACWTLQGENVVLVYPDGDQGILPVSLFKEAGV